MKISSAVWVYLAALIAAFGVAIHVGAVFGGPSWFAFFNAPPSVVASARAGTWLAPASALAIAALMAACTYYAASGVGIVPRPPLQRIGLAAVAVICVLRAVLLPVLAIRHAELRNTFEVVAAIIWFVAGVGFAVGFRLAAAGHNASVKRMG